jgi:hypothetical protein
MMANNHGKNGNVRFEYEDEDDVSADDLRVIIKQLEECWQLGDNNVMREARSALLAVFEKAAQRLARHAKARGSI